VQPMKYCPSSEFSRTIVGWSQLGHLSRPGGGMGYLSRLCGIAEASIHASQSVVRGTIWILGSNMGTPHALQRRTFRGSRSNRPLADKVT
jgi:hypothetical protein